MSSGSENRSLNLVMPSTFGAGCSQADRQFVLSGLESGQDASDVTGSKDLTPLRSQLREGEGIPLVWLMIIAAALVGTASLAAIFVGASQGCPPSLSSSCFPSAAGEMVAILGGGGLVVSWVILVLAVFLHWRGAGR